jgi:hypothetical protein
MERSGLPICPANRGSGLNQGRDDWPEHAQVAQRGDGLDGDGRLCSAFVNARCRCTFQTEMLNDKRYNHLFFRTMTQRSFTFDKDHHLSAQQPQWSRRDRCPASRWCVSYGVAWLKKSLPARVATNPLQ